MDSVKPPQVAGSMLADILIREPLEYAPGRFLFASESAQADVGQAA